MKYINVLFFALIILVPLNTMAGDAVLYFERGHYWIELTFYGSGGEKIVPGGLTRHDFTIVELEPERGSSFHPSRVKPDSSRGVVILSSGKLRGKRCYRVIFRENKTGHIVFDRVCDPFYFEPGDCGPGRFFARYIAPAFSSSGNNYELSSFNAVYEMSEDRADTELHIKPRFSFGGWSLKPYLDWDRVTYRNSGTDTGRRLAGLEGSYSKWFNQVRYRFRVDYQYQLITESDPGSRYSQHLKTALSVRLDHFFKGVNSFCRSVFKGVDLGFGYAWYGSNSSEVWGSSEFGNTAAFMEGRLTWTVLYGLQFSYSVISSFPAGGIDNFNEFHQFRLRLLLRGMLEPPERKSYHPDLVFAYDTGRRFPLFLEEEKMTLGFVFDLFPW
ncbi:MAG: hypothetical protein R6U43_10325 [Candidatus Krumholzibacteriales bacterium]